MEIQFYGANCIRLSSKKGTIVIDDNLKDLGLKSVTKSGDIALFSSPHGADVSGMRLVIDLPGEYEVAGTSVRGISAQAHLDEPKQKNAVIYKLVVDDIRIVSLGHIYPDLNDEQLEALGTVDVLFVPVGGHGYTLDAIGALKVIRKIEPKLVIPTHYADPAITYPMPQAELSDALKGLSMEPKDTVSKLKLKAGELGDVTQLIVLERQ